MSDSFNIGDTVVIPTGKEAKVDRVIPPRLADEDTEYRVIIPETNEKAHYQHSALQGV